MPSRVCWCCRVKAHQELIDDSLGTVSSSRLVEGDDREVRVAAFRCQECHYLSVGLAEIEAGFPPMAGRNAFDHPAVEVIWLPRHGPSKDFPDVPEQIARVASQAHECRAIGALDAAVMAARAAVEATAKHHDITKGTLFEKIEALQSAGVIHKRIGSTAHYIRDVGNDAAHGDLEPRVTSDDATAVLKFLDELLHEVFQGPAELERAKELRESRVGRAGQ